MEFFRILYWNIDMSSFQYDSVIVIGMELSEDEMGVAFFRNAVQYIRNHLL